MAVLLLLVLAPGKACKARQRCSQPHACGPWQQHAATEIPVYPALVALPCCRTKDGSFQARTHNISSRILSKPLQCKLTLYFLGAVEHQQRSNEAQGVT